MDMTSFTWCLKDGGGGELVFFSLVENLGQKRGDLFMLRDVICFPIEQSMYSQGMFPIIQVQVLV